MNEEQDYTEFEPEDGCFAAPRGKVPAAKKKKPAVRRIKGASGDLYDHDSDAHHRALEQLAIRLRGVETGTQLVLVGGIPGTHN
jgi:hypothetical protein